MKMYQMIFYIIMQVARGFIFIDTKAIVFSYLIYSQFKTYKNQLTLDLRMADGNYPWICQKRNATMYTYNDMRLSMEFFV